MRDRNVHIVCYPESLPNVETAILNAKPDRYAYILHDRDSDVNGEQKKPHWHVLMTFDNAREFSALGKAFGVGESGVEKMKSLKASVRYLRHLDNPEKCQYTAEEVQHSEGWNLDRYFSDGEDDIKAAETLDIVQTIAYNGGMFAEVVSQCCERGLYSYLRRGGALFLQVYKEARRMGRGESED